MIEYENGTYKHCGGGILVAIEGPDGSGKSTLIELVRDRLSNKIEKRPWSTREPGGTKLGKILRSALKDPELQDETPALARRLLFESDRMVHDGHLRRWLLVENNPVVLTDRHCVVSNAAYGEAEETDLDALRRIESLGESRVVADLVILLDVPADVCLERLAAAGRDSSAKEVDLAERDTGLFRRIHRNYANMIRQAVVKGYLTTVTGWRLRAEVINGDQPENDVAAQICAAIERRLSWAAIPGLDDERAFQTGGVVTVRKERSE